MYTLKVPSKLSLSCWFSRSNVQQQVVRHAICCDSAWYVYVPAFLCSDLDSCAFAQLSVSWELFANTSMCYASLRRLTSTLHRFI